MNPSKPLAVVGAVSLVTAAVAAVFLYGGWWALKHCYLEPIDPAGMVTDEELRAFLEGV